MKKIFVFVLCACLSTCVCAKLRTFQDVQQIVNQFEGNTGGIQKEVRPTAQLVYTKNGSTQPLYYVFNRGTGFVIVSADDRATEILGYSDAGPFNIDSLPDNFRSWLSVYATELEGLSSIPEQTGVIKTAGESKTRATGRSQSPLLGNILWDQGDPYNLLCPTLENGEKTVVGCVATAMAQIMRYHQWPQKGTGLTPSYTTSSNQLKIESVNLANTTYDWDNMLPVYNESSTFEEKMAVATLMYHCGISVEMDYGTESGAFSSDVPNALKTYFGYNENMNLLFRDYYTKEEWESIIKTELDEKRPIYCSGSSVDGGHAFVCDGYDANGLFHINWGWNGLSNGYFILSNLSPSVQGTGGSSGGYNMNQAIVVGIQPQTMPDDGSYQICMDHEMSVPDAQISRSEIFQVTVENLWNAGIKSFEGNVGPALYDDSGEMVCALNLQFKNIVSYGGWSSLSFTGNKIPSWVQDGTYRLYLVYQAGGLSDYHIIRTPVGIPNCMQVTVSGNEVTFGEVSGFDVDLQLDSFEVIGNLYQNRDAKFRFTVTNNGVEYVSCMVVYLRSVTDDETIQWGNFNPVVIANGETQTFEVSEQITVEPGEYELYLLYDKENSYNNIRYLYILGGKLVTVLETPEAGVPDLQVLNPISFEDNNNVNCTDMNMTVDIINRGAYFSDDIVAFIFPGTGGQSLGYFGYQPLSIDTNETSQITLSGGVGLENGTYILALYYWYDNSWVQFAPYEDSELIFVSDISTALDAPEVEGMTVYPNPARDYMYVRTPDKALDICVYDLSGRQLLRIQPETEGDIQVPVADLQAGTYMLVVHTSQEMKTMQFIKK